MCTEELTEFTELLCHRCKNHTTFAQNAAPTSAVTTKTTVYWPSLGVSTLPRDVSSAPDQIAVGNFNTGASEDFRRTGTFFGKLAYHMVS